MRPFRQLAALLLVTLLFTPLAAYPVPTTALAAPADPIITPAQTPTVLPPLLEAEEFGATTNDTPVTAESIGPVDPGVVVWSQIVTGTIGRSGDLDFYRFELLRPASRVDIALSNLPVDYDLIFGGGVKLENGALVPVPGFEPGLPDLEGIIQLGGSIKSIGGSIKSIGGSIKSIGGSIKSIGGSIKSIGGSIKSISATAGTTNEQIETFVWQPGVYFVAVAAANGEFSAQPYRMEVRVQGSSITAPPPAPQVEFRMAMPTFYESLVEPKDITTLYLYHPARLTDLYGPIGASDVMTISNALEYLTGIYGSVPTVPNRDPEYGVVINLSELIPISSTTTITDVYALWDANQANPLYANFVAGLIRNVIKAATADTPGASGPNPTFQVGNQPLVESVTFPNVRNIVLVGGDNVLPFFRLPDLTDIANEAEYFAYTQAILNQDMIAPDSALGAALRYRMLLSDNPYGTNRPYDFYGAPLFLPELAVGRLVERPDQIAQYLRTYQYGYDAYDESNSYVIDATATPVGQFALSLPDQPSPQQLIPPRPTKAFVSGYDFLTDQASEVSAVLAQTGLTPPTDTVVLNNDQWTRIELERDWFNDRLPEFVTPVQLYPRQVGLSSVNAHFDHWQLIPALDTAGNFDALRLLRPNYDPIFQSYSSQPTYFRSTLGYSVGCHSGYSMIDASIALTDGRVRPTYTADFPEAFNRHGGNWIGNTGYGYGTADGIDYSERLSVFLTEELARATEGIDGTTTYARIGDALMLAKQRYVRNATSLSEYDYKSLSIMTLYGLPFISVAVTSPLPPTSEDPRPGEDVPVESPAPFGANAQGQLTRVISFTLAITDSDFLDVDRTGSRMLQLSSGNFTIGDQFVAESLGLDGGMSLAQSSSPFSQTVRIFDNHQVGAPKLPTFAYDISALANDGVTRLRVRDVVFLGGTYGELSGFDPQMAQIVTETTTPIISTTIEPRFEAGAGIWFPAKFFGHSRVGTGELQRDQLIVSAAQFKANEDGTTGMLRPYTEMSFRVLYEDPTLVPADLQADQTAPLIESVKINPLANGAAVLNLAQTRSRVVVRVNDDGPVGPNGMSLSEVSLVYVENDTRWVERSLTFQAATGLYTTDLPQAAGDVRVIVRATDHAGNSSFFTAKGTFQPTQPAAMRIWLPLLQR